MLLIWLLASGHSIRCRHTDGWAGRFWTVQRAVLLGILNAGSGPVLDRATGGPVRDSQCGFRALNRRAIELLAGTLVKDDFAVESEMARIANEHKLRFADVEINCKYGNFKTSTKNPMSHGVGVLNSVIGLIAEKRPLLYIGLPGFITFVIGVFFGILLLQQYNQTRYFSLAYAMLVSIFMILGAIGLFMGLTLNVIARLREKDGDHK
jgi:hypothetical protein